MTLTRKNRNSGRKYCPNAPCLLKYHTEWSGIKACNVEVLIGGRKKKPQVRKCILARPHQSLLRRSHQGVIDGRGM